MVTTEREQSTPFKDRAMEKVFPMGNGWAIVHMVKLGDIEFERVIENIFNNGITQGQITTVGFNNGYKEGDHNPGEITLIIDPDYIIGNSDKFAEKNSLKWELFEAILSQHISGVILSAPHKVRFIDGAPRIGAPGPTNDVQLLAEMSQKEGTIQANQIILRCLLANMERTDNPMPVYLFDGSLLWPQQLSLGQVQSIAG